MRSPDVQQLGMFSYVTVEDRVPPDRPIRKLWVLVDAIWGGLDTQLAAHHTVGSRPSILPERILRASLLQVVYSVRSERLLREQLNYNLLFRWFVGLNIDDPVWDHSTFSFNRQRLFDEAIAQHFFDTPTDPDARLIRNGKGKEAKLSYLANSLMENRHGLVIGADVRHASGTGECDDALDLLTAASVLQRATLGADKGYDTQELLATLKTRGIVPHIARNTSNGRRSAMPRAVASANGGNHRQRERRRETCVRRADNPVL